jgi:hypothetical protein
MYLSAQVGRGHGETRRYVNRGRGSSGADVADRPLADARTCWKRPFGRVKWPQIVNNREAVLGDLSGAVDVVATSYTKVVVIEVWRRSSRTLLSPAPRAAQLPGHTSGRRLWYLCFPPTRWFAPQPRGPGQPPVQLAAQRRSIKLSRAVAGPGNPGPPAKTAASRS